MGKSTGCLRIIACGGGSIIEANEGGPVDQTRHPKGKKGWGFKKKTSTSGAVANSLITETPSFEHVNLAARDSFVSEKDSAPQWGEKSLIPPQVTAELPVPDAVIVYESEAAANSYVADEVPSSQTDKKPATAAANSYVSNDVPSSQTDKKPATAAAYSYVSNDVPPPKTEKHSDAANLCASDGLTVPKISKYEAVLTVHESDARREIDSIIKLQAMVRGHLVRCHAVGALRCVQAIAKMQILVRARYARTRKDRIAPKSKPEITYTSMTDLLKNSFARQLLESSPKSKPIKIKCDPLSRDLSWVWLERWMSLASPGAVDDLNAGDEIAHGVKFIGKESEETTIDKEQEEKITVEDYLFNEENEIFLDARDILCREQSKLGVPAEAKVTNSVELTVTYSNVNSHLASLVESQKPDVLDEVETVESVTEKLSVNHTASESQPEIDSVDKKSESKTEQALELETEVTRLGNEVYEKLKTEVEIEVVQLQTETKNFVSVSQEEPISLLVTESELVSAPSANLSDSNLHDAGVEEPLSDTHPAIVYHDSIPLKDEIEAEEGPASVPTSTMDYIHASPNVETEEVALHHSSEFDFNEETAASSEDDIVINRTTHVEHSDIQVCESDCSTELFITSTLDSPDRSEIERVKVELEKVVPVEAEPHESKLNTIGDELEIRTGSVEKGKSDAVNCESAACATADDTGMIVKVLETSVSTLEFQTEATGEKGTETDVSDLHAEPVSNMEMSHQASPGSQETFSESQGTPSSQASVSRKTKIVKSGKSGSIKKRTILAAAKKSPMSISSDKNNSEQHSKEQSSVKRRASFGSSKHEASDQEQRRDSSTSSSLPSYMQATESARAKANGAGQSPRSSPDVPDNDVFLGKRHSLSNAKDKQDSPRLSRTSSQAGSGTKSNGTSPLERKWQR